MRNVWKVYDMELTVTGPLYIGSGREIGKKEYAFWSREKQVGVFDMPSLCALLKKRRLLEPYERFMLGNSRIDMGGWLEQQKVARTEYDRCIRYRLDCGDAVLDNRSKLSILACMKDEYGLPYVPGSSLKGMLRTVLLAQDIGQNREAYRSEAEKVFRMKSEKRKTKNYLNREARSLENKYYRTLHRPKTEPSDAVNDTMAGILVGDSAPLKVEDLILCQRTELHLDGKEKKLNVLREAIRPGTTIRFSLTIDESISRVTKEQLQEAISQFGEMYYQYFLKKYHMDVPDRDTVWLGGGVGFVSKTEIYPLLGREAGMKKCVEIFEAVGFPPNHKHYLDCEAGVSPHVCKVTYYKGQRYHMGQCQLKIL